MIAIVTLALILFFHSSRRVCSVNGSGCPQVHTQLEPEGPMEETAHSRRPNRSRCCVFSRGSTHLCRSHCAVEWAVRTFYLSLALSIVLVTQLVFWNMKTVLVLFCSHFPYCYNFLIRSCHSDDFFPFFVCDAIRTPPTGLSVMRYC